MPRLLQIDSCLGVCSTGRITEGIAQIAIQNGWECYIAHGARYVGSTIQHHYRITSKIEEYIHYAQSLLFGSHGLHSSKATRKLIRWIKNVNPDIINLHCIHGYYLNYKILFEFLDSTDIPVVWTFHDCWSFTGHCGHFESTGCNRWKSVCYGCSLKQDYPRTLIIDRSKKDFILKKKLFASKQELTIVPVSKWLDSLVGESFFKEKSRHVIYNGIDTDTFKFRESNLRQKLNVGHKIVLLAAASAWSKAKGLDDYIKLSKSLPSNYQIILVGIPKDLKKSLPPSILCLPRTNNAIELAELYSMADISLNLSYQETFGLTTVEAMSCGTPCIVYNRTASPELVSEETGLVVPAGDINSLVSSIVEISTKGKAFYKDACRNRVLNYFDKKDRFEEYVQLYNKILANK
jgi:glycosyltransferase involved in cell wall biosynthesis